MNSLNPFDFPADPECDGSHPGPCLSQVIAAAAANGSDDIMTFEEFEAALDAPLDPDPAPLTCCGITFGGVDAYIDYAEHRADHEVEPDWDDSPADGCAICDRADHLAAACPERHADDEPLNAVECLVCGEIVYAEFAFGKGGCVDCDGIAPNGPGPELDNGLASNLKKEAVMDFAYKADLIFEVMVTQRNKPRTFEEKISSNVPSQCRRCLGTGRFITGTLNGKPTGPGGPCYRCAGKGFQTKADQRRNWGYDNFGQRVAVGPAPTIVAVHEDSPCPHCDATTDHTVEACGL